MDLWIIAHFHHLLGTTELLRAEAGQERDVFQDRSFTGRLFTVNRNVDISNPLYLQLVRLCTMLLHPQPVAW